MSDIKDILIQSGALIYRPATPFRLKSGGVSPYYFDLRKLLGDTGARRAIVSALAEHYRPGDVVTGVATGGIAWAAWIAELCDAPLAYVRAATKAHGTSQAIEGADVKGRHVLLLEDVVTTGASVLLARDALEAAGAIARCVCIVSRGQLDGVISLYQFA